MNDAIFKISNLRHSYLGRQVLNLDEFLIFKGEIFALVGPSGAGKSTLLRLLNFLELPTTGKISFSGNQDAQRTPLQECRRITTVFQRPILLNRSVASNLRYATKLRGESINPSDLEDLLSRLNLLHLINYPARKLSEGEAQRVSLARALLIAPDVLLLDEPTANLDPYNVHLIETILREENEQRGTTIVLVSHNIFQAQRLAHRIGFLLQGALIETAETTAFFDSPRHEKTAAFIRGDLVF